MTTINNETKVRALITAGKGQEAIVDYLVMNDDYRTKPEARTALEAFMTANKLVPEKKVPMSQQYEAWYKALSREDKLAQTKKSLHNQAVAIGMSDKSADWYARVYELAGRLALEMSQAVEPADEVAAWVVSEQSPTLLPEATGERPVLSNEAPSTKRTRKPKA